MWLAPRGAVCVYNPEKSWWVAESYLAVFFALGFAFVALTFLGLLAGFFAGFVAFFGVLGFFAAGLLAFFGLLVAFFGVFLAALFGDFLTTFFGVFGFLALGLVTFSTLPNLKEPAAPVPFVWTSLPAAPADLR